MVNEEVHKHDDGKFRKEWKKAVKSHLKQWVKRKRQMDNQKPWEHSRLIKSLYKCEQRLEECIFEHPLHALLLFSQILNFLFSFRGKLEVCTIFTIIFMISRGPNIIWTRSLVDKFRAYVHLNSKSTDKVFILSSML